MTYSGSGDVTAPVTAVGPLNVPIGDTPAGTTVSGCAASDFNGFPAGNIALVQRGTCTFGAKAANAKAAGASAVVIFNEGQPGRDGVLEGTLGRRSRSRRSASLMRWALTPSAGSATARPSRST